MSKMIFVNLPVSDLARSIAFYEAIGGTKNAKFSNEHGGRDGVSATSIYVMLLTHDFYRTFTTKEIADPSRTSGVLLALSCDSRGRRRRHGRARGRGRRNSRSRPEAGYRLHVRPQLRGSRRPSLGTALDGPDGRRARRARRREPGRLSDAGRAIRDDRDHRLPLGARRSPRPGPRPARPLGAGGDRPALSGPPARRDEPRPADYFDEQPFGQVPAYRDGEVQLFESGAILLHLGDRGRACCCRADPQARDARRSPG